MSCALAMESMGPGRDPARSFHDQCLHRRLQRVNDPVVVFPNQRQLMDVRVTASG